MLYFWDMNRVIILLVLILLSWQSNAQCDTSRYISPILNVIDVQTDVEYGQAPQWNFPYFNETLLMDVYRPLLDPIEKRPCMLWAHSGAFALGDKQADDMVALCDSSARRGFVTATMGYRKGFNPLDAASSERAVYRGLQDGRAAYRFLVENHEVYGIDTTKIFVGGSSAGALIALHLAFMEEEERPESSFDQFLAPDLGCIDCSGNNFQHEVNPLGIIGLWGAIGDTTWVNSDVNTLLAHGTEDPIVPFESGPPFQFFTLPDVYGSSLIHERLQNQGLSSELIIAEGEGHEPHGTLNGNWIGPPNDFWEELFSSVEEFCFELIRPQELAISGSEFICEGQNYTYSVELAEGESVCWEIEGGTYQETSDEEIAVQITGQSAIITAFIYNEVGAASESSSIILQASPSPDAAWDVSLEQNVLDYSVLTLFDTSWYLNGLLISEENIGSMLLKTEGEYTVSLEVVNELGCVTSYSEEFTYAIDNLDEQANSLTEVKLSSGVLSIKSEVITKVNLYDVMGRLLYENEATEHVVSEHSGVYILSFSNSEESRAIKIVFP
jgi:hypothetical protein